MNVSRSILRQLATRTTSRSGASRALPKMMGSRFCTGGAGDIPASAINQGSSASFSSKASLLDMLNREHQEEIDTGNTAIPQDLADLKASLESSWKIVEKGASINMQSLRDDKVRVSFHCQDTVEVEAEYDEDEEDPPTAPVRFTVTVIKSNKSLNFACFSEEGAIKIEGISTTAASTVDYVHDHQGMLPKIEYQGPDVTELAEDLQEGLYHYLEEELGVDGDVAAFVAMASDYREEINYVDFLKTAQDIIS